MQFLKMKPIQLGAMIRDEEAMEDKHFNMV
jgi:hypothetical protein